MASLAGKADATLVTAATRASLANVPGDYSKQWETATKARTTLFEGLDTMHTEFKKNKAAAVKEVDALKDKFYQFGATIENEHDYDNFQTNIDVLLNEAKENDYFKNDPKGRAKFERKLNQEMQPYTVDQKAMATTLEAWDSETAWKNKLKGDELELFKNIILYADNAGDYNAGQYNQAATDIMANNTGGETDVTLEKMWDQTAGADAKEGTVIKYLDPVSGEFTYVTKVGENIVSKKSSDLAKSVPQRDKEGKVQFGEYIDAFEDNAGKSKTAYGDTDSKNTKSDLRNFIDERLEVNKWALQDLMDQTHGPQDMSFDEAVRKGHTAVSMDIIQALENMSASEKEKRGYIGDEDGVFGSEDFATPQNYNAMLEYILESEEGLDFRKEAFIDYMDETVFKPLHDHQASKTLGYDITDALGEFKQRKITTKYGNFTGQDLVHDAEGIKRMQAGELEEGEYHESVVSGNRYRYDKENDQWYIQQPEFDNDNEFTGWGTEEEKSLREVQQDMGHGNYLKELGNVYRTSAVDADDITDDDEIVIPTEDKTETGTNPISDLMSFESNKTYKPGNYNISPIDTRNITGDIRIIKVNEDGTYDIAETIGNESKLHKSVTFENDIKTEGPAVLQLLQEIGATQEQKGDSNVATFVNYTGNSIFEAEKALTKAKENGFEDAFVKYLNDGKEISKESYNKLKDKSKVTFKTQIAAGEYNKYFDTDVEDTDAVVEDPVVEDTDVVDIETEETTTEEVEYGPSNPDPMAGTINTPGDMILNESGKYISIDSKEGKKIAKKYLGMQDEVIVSGTEEIVNTKKSEVKETVESNPVLDANVKSATNTNPIKYIVDNGYLNINEAQTNSPLVKKINGVYEELLGTATDSLAVTKPLTHKDKAWCGAFVYNVLTSTGAMKTIEKSGDKIQSLAAYSKLRAKEYLKVGTATKEPKMGDIVVVSRMVGGKKQHHVAFYAGTDKKGNVIMLGGNQDDEVSFKTAGKEYTIEGYRKMENMSDIQEAAVIAYKTKHGVKGKVSKTT